MLRVCSCIQFVHELITVGIFKTTMLNEICPCVNNTKNLKRTMDDNTSSYQVLPMGTMKEERKYKKRHCVRRVHFEANNLVQHDTPLLHTDTTRPLNITIYIVENVMNLVEKDEIWFPSNAVQKAITIRNEYRLCQKEQEPSHSILQSSYINNSSNESSYSNAIEGSYYRCCQDSDNGNELYDHCMLSLAAFKNMNDHDAGFLYCNNTSFDYQLLGMHRGMETYCVPALGIARLTVRKNMIQNVVMVDQLLRNHPQRTELLACIASQLTIPSKRFAHMYGIVDAMSATANSASSNDMAHLEESE